MRSHQNQDAFILSANSAKPILDVRSPQAFVRLHRAGAVNIPLEELADRIYELSPRTEDLLIFDADPRRARWARSRLKARDRINTTIVFGENWLNEGPTATGPSTDRLWKPHQLLIEAITHFRDKVSVTASRALDIACGAGRDAVYLALCGFETHAWDVLPDALARCEALASRSNVHVRTRLCDAEDPDVLGNEQFDLIACFNFLHRPLMPLIAAALRPGGMLVYETFVHPQRDMFGKPTRDSHLLKPRELPGFFPGFEIIVSREGLTGPRRMAASLIARRP
jgi:SAM-dependent methyltransferase